MKFHVAENELKQRTQRILYGLAFSLLLALLVGYQHFRYPEDYNDVLFWSVVGFVVLANLINYYRHRKYLKRAKDHSVELIDGALRFTTAGDASELTFDQVAAFRFFRSKSRPGHIQLQLTNNRGIRLEGYEDMPRLLEELRKQLPGKELGVT